MPPKQQKPPQTDPPELTPADSTRFKDEIAKDRRDLEETMTPRQWEEVRTRMMGGIILPRLEEETDRFDCGH